MLKIITAGESHGKCILAIVQGLPANLVISKDFIDKELARRQKGFGRGPRMEIEKDSVEILSGVRHGKTLGSPIALMIKNKDWLNWQEEMRVEESKPVSPLLNPRPGHADLAGALKYGFNEIRNVLERASARETVARVAGGALAKIFLKEFKITILSQVVKIGAIEAPLRELSLKDERKIESSPVRCFDQEASKRMVEAINQAQERGETLGGIFEVAAFNVPPGLGTYAIFEKRLDAQLASALISIPGVKGVEFGDGFKLADQVGSESHDEIFYSSKKGFYRKTNHAGGIEGGVSNGETILIRAVMKPIPTLGKPLRTVNILTKKPSQAFKERADICVVPSAAVIAENMVAFVLTQVFLEKFGGDSLIDIKGNYQTYLKRINWRKR